MNPLHEELIKKALPVFQADNRIAGVAAGGSLITDTMDEFSDIDLVISVVPEYVNAIMAERIAIARKLGNLLAAFTGEHVNEPRLLICLYGPPLLHVDLKFIAAPDMVNRVEDPVVFWERDRQISAYIAQKPARYPEPDLQWIEDRFWVWVHYAATKLGRGEIFEVIEFISYLRQHVIGPLILLKHGYQPSGVRKIEMRAKEELPLLIKTVPEYNAISCAAAVKILIGLYKDLRDYHEKPGLELHLEAEREAIRYFEKISDRLK